MTNTSFLDLAIKASQKIKVHVGLRTAIDRLAEYRNRHSQFYQLAVRLVELHGILEGLGRQLGSQVPVPSSWRRLEGEMTELSETFAKEHAHILKLDASYFRRWDAELKGLETVIKDRWLEYQRDRLSQISSEIVQLLGKLAPFQHRITSVKTALSRRQALLGALPPIQASDWLALQEADRQLQEAWQALDVDTLSPEVTLFLKLSQEEGVPLAQLTPLVLKWLEENGLSTFFKIKLTH